MLLNEDIMAERKKTHGGVSPNKAKLHNSTPQDKEPKFVIKAQDKTKDKIVAIPKTGRKVRF